MKDEQNFNEDTVSQGTPESRACFSPASDATGSLQYPAYFKDAKGVNHSVFGSNLAQLQYLNKGSPKMVLPDVIQHGRSAGMPLYVRCPICQKEFKQKSTLLQHGCIHIESRPYPCPDCGKRFRQQSHLTQHLRIHTNEKPYGCIYCPRFFRQRTILNQVGAGDLEEAIFIHSNSFLCSTFVFILERNRTNVVSVERTFARRPFWTSIRGRIRLVIEEICCTLY